MAKAVLCSVMSVWTQQRVHRSDLRAMVLLMKKIGTSMGSEIESAVAHMTG